LSAADEPTHPPRRNAGLTAIGIFKLFKATLVIVVGLGVLRLVHRDLDDVVRSLVDRFHFDPNGERIQRLIARFTGLSPRKLRLMGLGSLLYGALYLTEGIGLILQKRWAEWMTVISTAGFIPLEAYEIVHHTTWQRILLLIINLAIVVYLIWQLRRQREQRARSPR
jgi:uncharacterized membrane protein (DUF2068 family)